MPWALLDWMKTENDNDDRNLAWAWGLRSGYDMVTEEPVPDRFRDLLEQLAEAESRER